MTLAPPAVLLIGTAEVKPVGMPLIRAINDPGIVPASGVYAIMIGMLIWLITIPSAIFYAIVMTGAWIIRLRRRTRSGIM